ncbi:MAG: hypothetical protein M9962_07130 [Oligoflexia bacterium]|nr:hypothetical protein [Oligoflexia bacterium]
MKAISFLIITTYLLLSCALPNDPAKDIADDAVDNSGCENSESLFWDSLYRSIESGSSLPSPEEIETKLELAGENKQFSKERFHYFQKTFVEKYKKIYAITQKNSGFGKNKTAVLKTVIALETKDSSTLDLESTNKEIRSLQAELKVAAANLEAECPTNPTQPNPNPEPPPTPTPEPPTNPNKKLWDQWKEELATEIFGSWKTISTAYQSCEVLDVKPIDASVASMKGIEIIGRHPSGGNIRKIASLKQVQDTHYYLQDRKVEGSTCHDIIQKPLIYDFGGKPYGTSASPTNLNLFKDSGSGSSELGIDCSAYIFTALAAAGLKLDPSTDMKAIHVYNIPSSRYMKPESGMNCFSKVNMTAKESIVPGDVVSINGHIQMVDSIGNDPFGLSRARTISECNSSVLSYKGFDFVVSQSSPSRGALGINRMQAAEYLKESSTFRTGYELYAIAACKAKFGKSGAPESPSMVVTRHKKTKECRTTPFTLTTESCLYSCPAKRRL